MIWLVIWVVLMVLWIALGCYWMYEPGKPVNMGNTIIPWACVLILGLIVFGAVSAGTVVVEKPVQVVR